MIASHVNCCTLFFGKSYKFMNDSFGMDPAEGMDQDIELTRIITKCFIDTPKESRYGADPVDEFNHLSTWSTELCPKKYHSQQFLNVHASIHKSLNLMSSSASRQANPRRLYVKNSEFQPDCPLSGGEIIVTMG